MNIYTELKKCLRKNEMDSYTPVYLMQKYRCTYQDARDALETAADEGLLAYAGGMEYIRNLRTDLDGREVLTSSPEPEGERDIKSVMNDIYARFMKDGSATVPDIMAAYSLSYTETLDILNEMEECNAAEYADGMTWKALRQQDPDTEIGHESRQGAGSGLGAKLYDIAFVIYCCNMDIQICAKKLPSKPGSRGRSGMMDDLSSILDDLGDIYSKADELHDMLCGIPDRTKEMQQTSRDCLLLRRMAETMQESICRYIDNPGSVAIPASCDFNDLDKLAGSVYSNVLSISDNTK